MATHSSLTGADLHEPKGIDTADAGYVYVSDGAGSGNWLDVSVYGMMSVQPSDALSISTIGTTPQKIAGLTDGVSYDITADETNGEFTITVDGTYLVAFDCSFSTVATGDAGLYEFVLRKNAVETRYGVKRQMSGSSDTGSTAFKGILEGLVAGDVISIYIESDDGGNGDDINIQYMQILTYMLKASA